MQVLAIATAGLVRATSRLEASAQRTAQGSGPGSDLDYGHEVVEQISAKQDFRANLAVIKTADEMMGALLDIKV